MWRRSFLGAYWEWLLSGRYKLWHLIALGGVWVAAGGVLYVTLGSAAATLAEVAVVSGVAHWGIGAYAYRVNAIADARIAQLEAGSGSVQEEEPAQPERREPRPERPFRAGDDPFRDPPATPPIVVARPEVRTGPVPVREGTSDDKPKILS